MKQGDNLKPNMKQVKTIKKANKIIKVERWIERHGNKGNDWDGITASQLPSGRWLCEIDIPGVGITARAICKTESNAMLRAADKAYAIIKEFLHNNMNVDRTIENIRNWEMEIGENGEFISMGLSKKQREREGKQMFEMTRKTFEAVEKAIDKIEKVNGSTQDLIVEVIDRNNFSKDMSDGEVLDEFYKRLTGQYGHFISGSSMIRENLVIYVGYIFRGKGA